MATRNVADMPKSSLRMQPPDALAKHDSEALLAAIIAFSRDAIISVSPAGVIQTWNEGAQSLLGWSAQDAIGRNLNDLLADEAHRGADALLERAMEGARLQMELEVVDQQGKRLEVSVGAAPIHDRDGAVTAIAFVMRDLRRRRRSQANDALLASLVRQSGDSIFSVNRDGLISTWNPASEKLYGYGADEAIDHPLSMIVPDDKRDESRAMFTSVMQGEMVFLETVRQRKDGSRVDVAISGAPLRDAKGAIVGISVIHRDITLQRQHEQEMRLVMRELAHRSKNLLAIILSMAAQTARNAPSLTEFNARFTQRVQGLAHSHDLLVEKNWLGAPIRDLIQSHLEPFLENGATRVVLSGPDVIVDPKAAQNIGLALHELATNASKYGALSSPNGRVEISWERSSGSQFMVEWKESGGPRVEAPRRRGFGQTVLERLASQALEGAAHLSFNEEGVVWRMEIPAAYLVEP